MNKVELSEGFRVHYAADTEAHPAGYTSRAAR